MMNYRNIIYSLLISLPFTAHAGVINYEGSSTIGKFLEDASTVYKASTFKINTVPESAGGEQCAMRNTCDLGGVAREVESRFLENGVVATLIAKDAIAALVHNDNPVQSLTKAQLKDIFTGKIKNWSEVGGEDLPIKPYVVKEASATYSVFAKAVLDNDPYQNIEVITPDARMIPAIARERGAIGQLSFSFLVGVKGVKPLTIDGQAATVENPQYPISRPLYFTTKGEAQGEVKAFLDWALSDEGQKIVKQRFVGAH
ncbi:ABC-type phosphate transport system, periplasmic component [Beggiatoa alba B18LD]|uniref:ABC-type phosphate transport system, periplasmic component n=1 Tax=Beggiatoa alba B18LD TaxID=395493 RepID=I3CH21_9GAMM|nr:phosphate ABC transporter substrate-binding protein [Beggiatoa alba]EIJ42914.1 ABC-type phosphate transport system, periplasmic component [Beggiatoa alba B18LD]